MSWPTKLPILLFLLRLAATPSEIQTQHALDSSVKIAAVEPLWHFRARTKPAGGGLFQIRTGPIFDFDLTKRVTLIAGHYFTREQSDRGWTTTHRSFGGAETAIWIRVLEVDWRSLVERFFVQGESDYFRFRNRFRVSPPAVTAPYVSVEVFVDAAGFRSTRYSAGLRHTVSDDFLIDFGYFFENRRPMANGERHMFSTTFHWRNRMSRIDGDF